MFTYYIDAACHIKLIPFNEKGVSLMRQVPHLSVVPKDDGKVWLVLDGSWMDPSRVGIRIEWLRLLELE